VNAVELEVKKKGKTDQDFSLTTQEMNSKVKNHLLRQADTYE